MTAEHFLSLQDRFLYVRRTCNTQTRDTAFLSDTLSKSLTLTDKNFESKKRCGWEELPKVTRLAAEIGMAFSSLDSHFSVPSILGTQEDAGRMDGWLIREACW